MEIAMGSIIDHRLSHRARARSADDRPSDAVIVREISPEELPALRSSWQRLVEMAAEPNVFSEPAVLIEALASTGDDVSILVAEAGSRTNPETSVLCGVLPIVRTSVRSVAAPIVSAWRHEHAYLGVPLVRLDALESTLGAWLDHVAGLAPVLQFTRLPVGGPIHDSLMRVARDRGLQIGVWDQHSRAAFVRATTAEEFVRRSLPTKTRKELRRFERRLADRGEVRFSLETDSDGLDVWLDHFLELEAAGWKGQTRTALACSEPDSFFVRSVARNLAADDRLLRSALWLDDDPLSMQLSFLDGPIGWAFKIAHDPWWGQFSPGAVHELCLSEALHDTEIRWMDSCADPSHPMIDKIWDARIPIQSVWIGTGSLGATIASLAPAGKVIRSRMVRAKHPVSAKRGDEPIMRFSEQHSSLEQPFEVRHRLADHALFELERLVQLVERLPDANVEYNRGDAALVQDPDRVPRTGLTAAKTLRNIEVCQSWMVMKNVERDPEYRDLLDACVDEFASRVGPLAANDLRREAFVFVSSPGSITPFHIDPEHNVLFQIRGTKTMSIHDPGDPAAVSALQLERFFSGGHRNLDSLPPDDAAVFDLEPGRGVSVPVAAPHSVLNGPTVSISFSMTFRTPWSQRFARRQRTNHALRSRRLPTIGAVDPNLAERVAEGALVAAGSLLDRGRRLRER